jgi:hypothetical protein
LPGRRVRLPARMRAPGKTAMPMISRRSRQPPPAPRSLAQTLPASRSRSSASHLAPAACGADLGVGDPVGQQRVDLGRLGGGMAEAAAHDLDGDAAVEPRWRGRGGAGGCRSRHTSGGAVLLPPAVRRIVGQQAAAAVDGRAETAALTCTHSGRGRAAAARRGRGRRAARCGRCRPCRGRGRARRPAAGPGPRRTSRRPPRRGRRRCRRSRTARGPAARRWARPCAADGSRSRRALPRGFAGEKWDLAPIS